MGVRVTRKKLQLNVILVVLVLFLLVVAAVVCPCLYQILKDFSNIFIAIAAAYLAYCFQSRQAFIASLKELWHKCIEAKSELIEYSFDPQPDQEAFGKAHLAISTAIDMVRAIYRNVGENEQSIGLFPFEPLHDMRRTLDELGFKGITATQQNEARTRIMLAWNAFRWCFLREFSTAAPTFSITERSACDPRRVRTTI